MMETVDSVMQNSVWLVFVCCSDANLAFKADAGKKNLY